MVDALLLVLRDDDDDDNDDRNCAAIMSGCVVADCVNDADGCGLAADAFAAVALRASVGFVAVGV